jgi:hypothetical protein
MSAGCRVVRKAVRLTPGKLASMLESLEIKTGRDPFERSDVA